ncbi:unnamed protein product [Agarophyton chilense]
MTNHQGEGCSASAGVDGIGNDLAILEARCGALRVPLPFTASRHCGGRRTPVPLDAFSAETLSFFTCAHAVELEVADQRGSVKRPAERTAQAPDKPLKGAKRQKRFVSNWTPDMDKIVRKSLSKFGWGCWARIAASGKLPKEYTAKMIANRAKSIGLTKNMFGPAIVSTRTKPPTR